MRQIGNRLFRIRTPPRGRRAGRGEVPQEDRLRSNNHAQLQLTGQSADIHWHWNLLERLALAISLRLGISERLMMANGSGNGVWKWICGILLAILATGVGSYASFGQSVSKKDFQVLSGVVHKLATQQEVTANDVAWIRASLTDKGN